MTGESGAHTRLSYQYEDNGYDQPPSAGEEAKPFGVNASVETFEGRRGLRRVYEPANPQAIDILAMVFDGSFGISYTLTNPWWVQTLLGAPNTTDNGDGSHTHAFDNSATAYPTPDSFQVVETYERANAERTITGMIVTEATIDVTVEEEVVVTIRGFYADETVDTSPSSLTPQPETVHDPFTYVHGAVKIDGTAEGYVQEASVTVRREITPVRELGNGHPIDYIPRQLEPDVDLRKLSDAKTDWLEEMYGTTGATTPQQDVSGVALDLVVDNAQAAGSGINTLTTSLGGAVTESYDEQGVGDPRADLEKTVNKFARTLEAEATNEVAAPA